MASAAALNVDISGTGDGKVITDPDPFYEELQSTPPIECFWDASEAVQSGTCDAVAASPEAPNVARLVAEPPPGSEIKEWVLGPGVSAAEPCGEALACGVFTFGATPVKVEAIFEATGPPPLALTINHAGTGSGQVNCQIVGGALDEPCASTYPEGTELELEAAADEGSVFEGFEDGTGSAEACSASPCAFTLEEASSVTATFDSAAPPEFPLTLTKTGAGAGSVKCDTGAGPEACASEYPEGTEVTLTAKGEGSGVFTGWSGAGCSGTGTCEVTMSAAKSVEANFDEGYVLTVSHEGTGSGTVISSPAGIECLSGTCSAAFEKEASVTLTASPASGYAFSKWKGCTVATGLKCEVTGATSATKVIAYFVPTKTLTVTKAGSGYGKVTSTGISCDESCSTATSAIQSGKLVKVKAKPAKGSQAAVVESETGSAVGNCPGGEAACEFTIEADTSVKVKFEPKPTKTVTLNLTGPGQYKGKVTGKSTLLKGLVKSGLSCGTGCTTTKESFLEGDEVELTATAPTGYTFEGWSVSGGSAGTCTGKTTPCKAPIDATKTIAAEFK
jgi:hypothetical protein